MSLELYPSPKQLGFNPTKYPIWRQGQLESSIQAIEDLKSVDASVIKAPVGSGKTLIAGSVARIFLKEAKHFSDKEIPKVVILTGTKNLQDQYERDWAGSAFGFYSIKGANNYDCLALKRKEFNADIQRKFANSTIFTPKCDHAPCVTGIHCLRKENGSCLFYGPNGALDIARSSSVVITNYALWMTGALGKADLIICDEAHLLESEVDRAARINHSDMPFTSIEAAQIWATKRLATLAEKELTVAIKNEKRNLDRLLNIKDSTNWVYCDEPDNKGWSPVKHSDEGNTLVSSGNKFVFLSATVNRNDISRFRDSVDTRKLTWIFRETKSVFPVANRRVISYPLRYQGRLVSVTYKMDPTIATAHTNHIIKIINANRPDTRKGIVHCVSYDRGANIASRLRDLGYRSVYAPSNGRETSNAIRAYLSNPTGGILISPAVTTGYDFADNAARWQILCKAPFPITVNPLVKARSDMDPLYSKSIMIATVEQVRGRGTRNINDWCDTFIVDNLFDVVVNGSPELISEDLRACLINMTDERFKSWIVRV